MQIFRFPGAFANAAKIATRCWFEGADGPVVADRMNKLDRLRAARHNGLSVEDAARAVAVSRATLFRWDRRGQGYCTSMPLCEFRGFAYELVSVLRHSRRAQEPPSDWGGP